MRVGVLFSVDYNAKIVQLIGYGELVGDEIPPKNINPWISGGNRPNPKIILDDGDIVWGCECWWGAEDIIKEKIEYWDKEGYNIQNVRITEQRKLSA